jgi:hypothetical protein
MPVESRKPISSFLFNDCQPRNDQVHGRDDFLHVDGDMPRPKYSMLCGTIWEEERPVAVRFNFITVADPIFDVEIVEP